MNFGLILTILCFIALGLYGLAAIGSVVSELRRSQQNGQLSRTNQLHIAAYEQLDAQMQEALEAIREARLSVPVAPLGPRSRQSGLARLGAAQ